MNNSAYVSKILKILNEAEEDSFLKQEFKSVSDSSDLTFDGELSYTGQSNIELRLTINMPEIVKHYITENSYDSLSETQFNGAVDKIQNALKDISEEFSTLLQTKLASYGFKEGDNYE